MKGDRADGLQARTRAAASEPASTAARTYSAQGRASARKSMAFDAAIARVTLPATAANLRAATELDEHSDADARATAVAAISQGGNTRNNTKVRITKVVVV